MKKHLILIVLAIVLLLAGSTAYADGFSDLFKSVKDYDASLDRTTNNCIIQPKPEAIESYAVDGQLLLPCLTKEGDVLTIGFLMKGSQELANPVNMRIYTDSKVYTFVPSQMNSSQSMISITLGDQNYHMCMLPSYAFHVLSDIATSESVSVSYCANSGFAGASVFALEPDTLDAFIAVNAVCSKYFSVGEDGSGMYSGMDFLAEMMISFSEEPNNAGMWD